MPIIKKLTKAKTHFSKIKIQHCYAQEFIPIKELTGQELSSDLIPICETDETKNIASNQESAFELSSLKDIYTY